MTDTTTDLDYAREHAAKAWQMFTREKGLTDTHLDWQEARTPDGGLLLSGRLSGRRAAWALARFARDFFLALGPGDQRPQFDIHQSGRTVLVWRYGGVWVELWHPDSVVDVPEALKPVLSAPVPAQAAPTAPKPMAAAGKPRRTLLGPGGRLVFTRNRRTTNEKETTA